jgi:hypothetical protein
MLLDIENLLHSRLVPSPCEGRAQPGAQYFFRLGLGEQAGT